jgi:hypothetical protein
MKFRTWTLAWTNEINPYTQTCVFYWFLGLFDSIINVMGCTVSKHFKEVCKLFKERWRCIVTLSQHLPRVTAHNDITFQPETEILASIRISELRMSWNHDPVRQTGLDGMCRGAFENTITILWQHSLGALIISYGVQSMIMQNNHTRS